MRRYLQAWKNMSMWSYRGYREVEGRIRELTRGLGTLEEGNEI